MDFEPELKAMNEIYNALKDLESEERQRVIGWVVGKFSITNPIKNSIKDRQEADDVKLAAVNDFSSFKSIADIFTNAKVKRAADKVLIVGAYLQQKQDGGELTGREINKELHHLGHRIGNITNAISTLINEKPQLMIQIRKEGKTKQAQKKYKVTAEGFTAANKIINPEGNSSK